MKRTAKRIFIQLTPEQRQQWQADVAAIDADADQIAADFGKRIKDRTAVARAEMSRVANTISPQHHSEPCEIERLRPGNPTLAELQQIAASLGKVLVIALAEPQH